MTPELAGSFSAGTSAESSAFATWLTWVPPRAVATPLTKLTAWKLPVGERRRVHAALCALVAQKPRFKALVVDLAKISNGETSLDAILAYEIAPQ